MSTCVLLLQRVLPRSCNRRPRFAGVGSAALLVLLTSYFWPVWAQEQARPQAETTAAYPITWEYNVMVPMRDGVRLATDVFRPDTPGRFPVIVTRTPYGKGTERDFATFFSRHGYVALVEDVRGRYDSQGEWYPLFHEADDGYDAIEWAARQPWSNGQVIGWGGSYAGVQQWLAATRGSVHLKAITPTFAPSDLYGGWLYVGGAFQEAIAVTWAGVVDARVRQTESLESDPWQKVFQHLPVTEALHSDGHNPRFYDDWLAHPTYDAYWRKLSWEDSFKNFDFPVFLVDSWYDIFNVQKGTIDNFEKLRGLGPRQFRNTHRLILGPWEHGPHGTKIGEVEFGPQSVLDFEGAALRWLDHYIKGIDNGAEKDAPVKVFTMGENAWHDYNDWPVPGTQYLNYYVRSGGRANTLLGDGTLSVSPPTADEKSDQYTYDPTDPVPNAGGGNCCWPEILPWGPHDQRAVERRDDVLVYSTPPLDQDLRVTGSIIAKLWVMSSARDTDFAVKLVDVYPNGFAMNLTDGILRARYRNSLEKPELLEPGHNYELTIDLGSTSNLFKKDHSIRVEVASGNFPRYSRNTNTGQQGATDTKTEVARQSILHDREHPSHIVLPVLP